MKRFSDAEILGLYVPRGLSPPIPADEQLRCVRAHCSGSDPSQGNRSHRWTPRYSKQPVIEFCPRCHNELVNILGGG